jgi:hypothetical protein
LRLVKKNAADDLACDHVREAVAAKEQVSPGASGASTLTWGTMARENEKPPRA